MTDDELDLDGERDFDARLFAALVESGRRTGQIHVTAADLPWLAERIGAPPFRLADWWDGLCIYGIPVIVIDAPPIVAARARLRALRSQERANALAQLARLESEPSAHQAADLLQEPQALRP